MQQDFPILEYDPDPQAVIDIDLEEDAMPGMPEHCVVCFFREVFERLLEQGRITLFTTLYSEMADHPVYLYPVGDRTVALLHQG